MSRTWGVKPRLSYLAHRHPSRRDIPYVYRARDGRWFACIGDFSCDGQWKVYKTHANALTTALTWGARANAQRSTSARQITEQRPDGTETAQLPKALYGSRSPQDVPEAQEGPRSAPTAPTELVSAIAAERVEAHKGTYELLRRAELPPEQAEGPMGTLLRGDFPVSDHKPVLDYDAAMCAPGCDYPVTGYHARRNGVTLCSPPEFPAPPKRPPGMRFQDPRGDWHYWTASGCKVYVRETQHGDACLIHKTRGRFDDGLRAARQRKLP